MKECKRLKDKNQDLQYPTLKSIHKVVLDSGRYPMWSYSTFREILLAMEIRMKTKSETDWSILIEDPYIENWRVSYLTKMEMHRISARPRFFMDETYIDGNSQPTSFLTDCTIDSANDARDKGHSTGLKWNPGRGNM